jgi:hypothetical protein
MNDPRRVQNAKAVTGAVAIALMVVVAGWPGAARAAVLFQNTGNMSGWGRVFTQRAGTITEVTSPVYKGTTAVKTTQTYQTSNGQNYHSEIIKTMAHLAGQDLYYGQVIYLPPDWVFHSQNVTFQQWAPEMPEAPWILMFLQGEKVRLGGRGANGDKDVGTIGGLRGTWIRIVTRIKMATDGAFEVWINGKKEFSQNGNFRAMGPSMRWSSGIYCTRWDTETPTGPRELSIFHDSLRIATTYEEADPESWSDGDAPPPAPDGGAGGGGGSSPDGGAVTEPDSGTPAPTGSGGSGGSGGTPEPTPPPVGGTGGSAPTGSPPKKPAPSSGCQVGGAGGGAAGWLAALGGLALAWRRRRGR